MDSTGKSEKKPVQEIIEIHEKLFKKCPISGKTLEKNDNGGAGKCPMTGISGSSTLNSGNSEKKPSN